MDIQLWFLLGFVVVVVGSAALMSQLSRRRARKGFPAKRGIGDIETPAVGGPHSPPGGSLQGPRTR
jgi:hypothetical protein